MEKISVPMNAVRVCDAIARIGYEPHSALMDIIDNSIAAKSKNVEVIIDLVDGKTLNQRNNVFKYRIVDDGIGMDIEGIQNAFKLGSNANYAKDSLSKYGMGLKSAGFSLGNRITVISKKDGEISSKYYVDRKIIKEANDYVVCKENLMGAEKKEVEELFSDFDNGSLIELTNCDEIHHASAKTTIKKLKHRLGVTYYSFLSKKKNERLNIKLSYPGNKSISVVPFDILFTSEANPSFSPDVYDCKVPTSLFKQDWEQLSDSRSIPPIKLEVVAFPLGKMGQAGSPLDDGEKRKIKEYEIKRENNGFFIYRNGRLIRWGENIDTFNIRDLINFRAKMELTSEHDDLLHVDVSKQRLVMDEEVLKRLATLMRIPLKQTGEIKELCNALIKKGDSEGSGFEETSDVVTEEDPTEDLNPPDPIEKKERSKKKADESAKVLKEIEEKEEKEEKEESEDPDTDTVDEIEFQRVRYTDNFNGMGLWSAQKDTLEGTFVLVNRRHAFYQLVISSLDERSPERMAIEALIYCSAIGEIKTIENLTSIDACEIHKVFEKYFKVLFFNIGDWAGGNQQLFD